MWRVACGKLCVAKGMISHWRFQIITSKYANKYKEDHPAVIIGIVDADNIPKTFNSSQRKHGYGYSACGYILEKHGYFPYGQQWKKGDIVTMILDMRGLNNAETGILSFELNGKPQGEYDGKAIEFLPLHKSYRMMMSCFDAGEKIKILS